MLSLDGITKLCTRCEQCKHVSEFYKDRKMNDGLLIYCKQCSKELRAPYLARSRQKRAEYAARHYRDNKERRRLYNHEYNKRPEVRERERLRKQRLEIEDPHARAASRLRALVRVACLRGSSTKTGKTVDLVGCTMEQFIKWIETNFLPGMTWTNHGRKRDQWSFDHYIPCDSFDLTDPEQQRKCFHWSNTFPMWHVDNLAKKNTVPSEMDEFTKARIALFQERIDKAA